MKSYAENMSKIWIIDENRYKSDAVDVVPLIIDRASVAMGDDVCSHTTIFYYLMTNQLSELCEYIIHGMRNIPIMRWKLCLNRETEIAFIDLSDKSFKLLIDDISIQDMINEYKLKTIFMEKFRVWLLPSSTDDRIKNGQLKLA